jgi:hypothetical protein
MVGRSATTRSSIADNSSSIPSPVEADIRMGRSSAGTARGGIFNAFPPLLIQQIDLVPDFDDLAPVVWIDAKIVQNLLDIARLRLRVFVRNVPHMQDDVGLDDLFQGRAKCRDQQVGSSEMKPTVSEKMTRAPFGSARH